MKPECNELLDQLLEKNDSPEVSAHTRDCPDCQSVRRNVQNFRHEGSLFEPASDELINRIANSIPYDQAPATAESSAPSFFSIGIARLAYAAGLFGLLLVIVTRFPAVTPTVVPPDSPVIAYPIGMPAEVKPMDQPYQMPQNWEFQVTQPSKITLRDRGMEIATGRVACQVSPDQEPFHLSTPHGHLEVIGTRFIVDVKPAETTVQVQAGKVRFTDRQKNATIIEAGAEKTWTLSASTTPGLSPASASSYILDPGGDVDPPTGTQ